MTYGNLISLIQNGSKFNLFILALDLIPNKIHIYKYFIFIHNLIMMYFIVKYINNFFIKVFTDTNEFIFLCGVDSERGVIDLWIYKEDIVNSDSN